MNLILWNKLEVKTSVKFRLRYSNFHSREATWKCRLQNWKCRLQKSAIPVCVWDRNLGYHRAYWYLVPTGDWPPACTVLARIGMFPVPLWLRSILVSLRPSARPSVRPSVSLSVRPPSRTPCPLCSGYSSGWIHFIFIHLIKQLQKVCRV